MRTQVYIIATPSVLFFIYLKVSGESRRGGEDKMLDDLEKSVLKIYECCVGENEVKEKEK